jgi:hypothetical protein
MVDKTLSTAYNPTLPQISKMRSDMTSQINSRMEFTEQINPGEINDSIRYVRNEMTILKKQETSKGEQPHI